MQASNILSWARKFSPLIKLVYCILAFSFFYTSSVAQRELVYAKDPASLRSELVSITHFTLPESYAAYAGTRFIDIRHVKGFMGFIQQHPKTGFRKITTAKSLEEELNSAAKIKKDSPILKDSIVIVLKNFWLSPRPSGKEIHCQVKAFVFTRRADSFFYRGKIDTLFKRAGIIRHEYKDMPMLFIEDMLRSFSLQHGDKKPYPEAALLKMLHQQKEGHVKAANENGLFFSFGDFLRGNIYKTNLSLAPFYEQYRLNLEAEADAKRNAGKIWGCWYNGGLYIRVGKHFSRAFAVENSFLVMGNPTLAAENDVYTSPVLLNMETGKLE